MEIAERLQMIIKMNKLTNAAFADRVGVQRSSVSHVLAGRNKPSIAFIQKIINHFPNVDAKWLITGKQSATTTPSFVLTNDSSGDDVVKSEDPPVYATKEKNVSLKSSQPNRKIEKIVVFYNDGTFEETIAK